MIIIARINCITIKNSHQLKVNLTINEIGKGCLSAIDLLNERE
jgi:hypothetical protein